MIMEIDIRDIKTYVISLKSENQRRENMKTVLHDYIDWTFIDALDVRGKFPYWIGCGLSHRKTLEKAEYPCLVLEDDVQRTKWYKNNINLSDENICYLGISLWGMKSGKSEYQGIDATRLDDERSIIKYMTSGHAIFYPTKEIAEKFYAQIYEQLFETVRPFDELYAKLQTVFETHCLNRPLFYQNCKQNEIYTNFEIQY